MKYFVRSIKYFFYLLLILALVILVLIAGKFVEADLSTMFVNGYDSMWQMALVMALFALVYPKFGFSSRRAVVPGSSEELKPAVMKVMDLNGYRLEKQEGEDFTFIRRSGFSRALKMWEDRISFTRTVNGYDIEGLTRDLPRIISGLEASRFQADE